MLVLSWARLNFDMWSPCDQEYYYTPLGVVRPTNISVKVHVRAIQAANSKSYSLFPIYFPTLLYQLHEAATDPLLYTNNQLNILI